MATRPVGAAGAAALALVLVAVAVLLEPSSSRAPAAALVAAGLAAGVLVGLRLPARARRTAMERLNDAAFVTVVAAASLLLLRFARPWTACVPGLVGGVVAGRAVRTPDPGPGGTDGV